MIRQARTVDIVLVKSREMTDRTKTVNTAVVAGGRKGKDDRKPKTLAALLKEKHYCIKSLAEVAKLGKLR